MTAGGATTVYSFTNADPNQLAGWTRTEGATCSYGYDANGNRTSKTETSGGTTTRSSETPRPTKP